MGKVYTKDDVAPSLINGKLVELTDEQKLAIYVSENKLKIRKTIYLLRIFSRA